MSFIMTFHHRDSLRKMLSQKKEAQNGKTIHPNAEKPILIPLNALDIHARKESKRDEFKPRKAADQPKRPTLKRNDPYSRASAYLTPEECDSLKFNQHASREKDQKWLASIQRRHKIMTAVLGLGLPLLAECFTGDKKSGKADELPARPVRHASRH